MKTKTKDQAKSLGKTTNLVRGGLRRTEVGETSEALFLTSGYVYSSAADAEARFKGEAPGFVYSRYGNPTVSMFEKRLAILEGAEGWRATSTGMAAVFSALMCQLRAGDHVISSRALFGSCFYILSEILPRYGIKVSFVDDNNLEQWRGAFYENTRCVFLETPSNPALQLLDLTKIAKLTRACGAILIVDNVFATPILQSPLEYGADIVVYSATKHIDGQGRCLGGAILSSQKFIDDELQPFLRHTGPALSPFNAWVLLKGLETLQLRVDQMCKNALGIAKFLEDHKQVKKVLYPGLKSHPQYNLARRQMLSGGTIVSFYLNKRKKSVFDFLDRLNLIDISNNLGDSKSLITHPATTTHQRLSKSERESLGISDGLLRLSVGLEDVSDITEDLNQALQP